MSFIQDYSDIVSYVESKIDALDSLSPTDAALVCAMAQLLSGRNQSISNLDSALSYLQGRQNSVELTTAIKEVTLLLGAAMASKNTVWRSREYLADGEFVPPLNIAGNTVWITGCGGGGGGACLITQPPNSGSVAGANAGCYVYRRPMIVTPSLPVPVIVGAGGAPVSVTYDPAGPALVFATGNAGESSFFGSLEIPGGDGALYSNSLSVSANRGGWTGGSGDLFNYSRIRQPQNSIAYRCGETKREPTNSAAWAHGSAGGAFGDAGAGAVYFAASGSAQDAPDNSGAGGGSVSINSSSVSLTATSGRGGSGRIIVEWQEFV